MLKKKRDTQKTGDAWSILNALGEPWTTNTWPSFSAAETYLKHWQTMNNIPLPGHRVVPVRVTVRLTKATASHLKKKL